MTKITSKEVSARASDPMAWFQHDSNARYDIKCQRLIMRYGNEAYGVFWQLCEFLAATDDHAFPTETDEDWMILANELSIMPECDFDKKMSIEKCKFLIGAFVEIGLIVRDGKGRIESKRMRENALYFGSKRAAAAKGGRPRKNAEQA